MKPKPIAGKFSRNLVKLNRYRFNLGEERNAKNLRNFLRALNDAERQLKKRFKQNKEMMRSTNSKAEILMQKLRKVASYKEYELLVLKVMPEVMHVLRTEVNDEELWHLLEEGYKTEIMLIGFALEKKQASNELKAMKS